ncbi:PREDICTED: allergin-1 isoform X2 [Sturnus vulgaris]|uniref:allergin-1 isoform X2 n=1 Tax=Sturnus vulgaris TaxID=9172 RepID=UPI00071A8705|nr:PREDICTED: allergin-1 isoform X2 [Sturnus vulgaris]
MLFLTILLFSYSQMSQQIQKTTANGKEMLSNPKLVVVQGTLNVVMKQNVTLSCLSQPGSPPVRYTLFKHNQQVSALNRSDLSPALFPLTISSASDVGEYKCKAEFNNSSGGKYSNSLNFTLIEERSHSQPLIISLGLILLLLIIGFALAIPFFIIPLYKAKKFKSTRPSIGLTSTVYAEDSENEVIYSEIEPVKAEEEYINFPVIRREEEKAGKRACSTVYSKVLIRD